MTKRYLFTKFSSGGKFEAKLTFAVNLPSSLHVSLWLLHPGAKIKANFIFGNVHRSNLIKVDICNKFGIKFANM